MAAPTTRRPSIRPAATAREVATSGGSLPIRRGEGASHRSENWWPSQWGYKRESSHGSRLSHPVPGAGRISRAKRSVCRKTSSISPGRRGLKLDAFVPRAAQPVPAVIVVHGGGWEAGDKVTYVSPLFEPLSRAGLAWFSIDYRLTPSQARGSARRRASGDPVRSRRARAVQHRPRAHRADRRIGERTDGDAAGDRGPFPRRRRLLLRRLRLSARW